MGLIGSHEELAEKIANALLNIPAGTDSEGNLINMEQLLYSIGGQDKVDEARDLMEKSWVEIGEALIEHVTSEAVVETVVNSHVHSGVTTGPGTSGPPVSAPSALETGEIK